MRRRIIVLPLLFVALVLLLTGCGKPKIYSSVISGVVTSMTGLPIYAASVLAQTGSNPISAFSDQNGQFTMTVPSGTVTLTASKAGYVETTQPPILIEKGQPYRWDVKLGVVTPSVTIKGDVTIGN